jgi:hypothetical protein
MNPEIKALWVAWLRDPEHEQGRGYLNRFNKLCCLGGLCELAAEAGVVEKKSVEAGVSGAIRYVGPEDGIAIYPRTSETVLPNAVIRWAGLDMRDPVVMYDGQTRSLTALNDDENLPFTAIARAIEEDEYL